MGEIRKVLARIMEQNKNLIKKMDQTANRMDVIPQPPKQRRHSDMTSA